MESFLVPKAAAIVQTTSPVQSLAGNPIVFIAVQQRMSQQQLMHLLFAMDEPMQSSAQDEPLLDVDSRSPFKHLRQKESQNVLPNWGEKQVMNLSRDFKSFDTRNSLLG